MRRPLIPLVLAACNPAAEPADTDPGGDDALLVYANCTADQAIYDGEDALLGSYFRQFDEGGRTLEEEDRDADGVLTTRRVHTYRSDDQVETTTTTDGDGALRSVASHTYDGDQLVRIEVTDADGTVVWTQTTTWDGDTLAEVLTDDGRTEDRVVWTWEGGDAVQLDYDHGNDGTIDALAYYTYDDHRVTRIDHDTLADGSIDAQITYTYEGDLVVHLVQVDPTDGTEGWRLAYTYDALGREVLVVHTAGDAVVTTRSTTWTCP